MYRFFVLILIIPCMYIASLGVGYFSYLSEANKEFLNLKLTRVANNASDSALTSMVINQTVNVRGESQMDPDIGFSTYEAVFLKSFNCEGEYHYRLFDSFIPAFIVATNDGYHIKSLTDCFSLKIPYARVIDTNPTNPRYAAFTLNNSKVYVRDRFNYDVFEYPANTMSDMIARQLVGHMSLKVDELNQTIAKWNKKFYIPDNFVDDTLYSTTSIKGPTVLALVQNFSFVSKIPLDIYTVSASQIVPNNGYVADGIYYYPLDIAPVGANKEPEFIYPSAEVAASLGYLPGY